MSKIWLSEIIVFRTYQYLLSVVEYAMQNSYLILKQVTNDLKNIDGIGFYSIFQLPFDDSSRLSFLKTVIKKINLFFFALKVL